MKLAPEQFFWCLVKMSTGGTTLPHELFWCIGLSGVHALPLGIVVERNVHYYRRFFLSLLSPDVSFLQEGVILGVWHFSWGFNSQKKFFWGETSLGVDFFRVFFLKKWKGLLIAWNGEKIDRNISASVVRGRAEGQACADPWARSPIGASGKFEMYFPLLFLYWPKWSSGIFLKV
jgi:hypothetical protein